MVFLRFDLVTYFFYLTWPIFKLIRDYIKTKFWPSFMIIRLKMWPLAFTMDGKISEQRVYCKIRAQLWFPPILRLKIRFGFYLRVTDLSLRAVAKHQIACCMQYSLIWKVQSFKFQSRKVVLSLENFTEKVFLLNLLISIRNFLLNLLISIRNADRASVSAASNYSMITHRPINPLQYRNIWNNLGSMS